MLVKMACACDGSVVLSQVKRQTISQPVKAYCEAQGLSGRQIRFQFEGQPISETDTCAPRSRGCRYDRCVPVTDRKCPLDREPTTLL